MFMRSGETPAVDSVANQYYSKCVSSTDGVQSQFTICLFRSELGLGQIPSISQADTGRNRLLSVVQLDNLEQIRNIVPNTPDVNYAWAIYGQPVLRTKGSYNLYITSEDW